MADSILNQAAQIASGGFDGNIDWAQEPRSDVERRVRKHLLEKMLKKGTSMAWLRLDILRDKSGCYRGRSMGSDLACAVQVVDEIRDAREARKEADAIRRAQRFVMFGERELDPLDPNCEIPPGFDFIGAMCEALYPNADEALRMFRERYVDKQTGAA